jgi:lipopolysaccharide export system permease protein
MPILTRYVLMELLKVFGTVLSVLTLMMLMVGLFREAAAQGLGPLQMLQLMPYILPDSLRFTVPAAVLFAVSNVYGRMSSSNEIVAIKSLGIHPKVLVLPSLALAFVLSITTVWLNDLAVSWGYSGIQKVIINGVEEIAYGMLRTQRAYSSNQFSIIVKDVDGRRLVKPVLTYQGNNKKPPLTVMAEEAELRADRDAKVLIVECRNFTVYGGDGLQGHDRDSFEMAIPLADATTAGKLAALPSKLSLQKIQTEWAAHAEAEVEFRQELAAKATYQMLTGDFRALAGPEWAVRAGPLKPKREHLARLATEPYRRWANGFSCLCFCLVGVPMSIRLRNADLLTSFFLCFAPILVAYYPLLAVGVDAAKHGTLPPIAVWLGNLVLALWGVWLLRRVYRY